MGILALLVFIAVTVVMNVPLKRPISESLLVALLATALVGGKDALSLLWTGVWGALDNDVTFAGMAFVFMGVIVSATGLIERLIEIFNSVFGRLRGGAAYVSTAGSAAIGLVAGSTAGNAATVGSVTIPWMKENGWSGARAATLVAGNSGLGVSLPPNSTMFIILATPAAVGVSAGDVYVSLFAAGAYCVLYRMLVVFIWTRRDGIRRTDSRHLATFGQALSTGWTSMTIFVGILIPVLLTFGPLFNWLESEARIGEAAMGEISIIVWVPILISAIALVEGRKRLRGNWGHLRRAIRAEAPQFATVGISLFAALAASNIMSELGVGPQLSETLAQLQLPKPLLVLVVCLTAVLVATPLSSTATAAAIAAPAVIALGTVDVPAVVAICAILVCTSTEGASPPVGAPIYLSAGMAEVSPQKTFVPLIIWFVVPIIAIAWLIAMGWLPIPS
ncbi:TRAP-type C4-dicarboxylate transport system, large permease component [Saccharopolyspora antimicrobica]|uniref:TRAP-type C4-dicarboxylate transport system permease large subunit n=1 Tax=Saccharopolyspora antimicrobica TaxID=455193 RepID=A0A1I4VRN0_9PSEU|nr:TRAP transporter large permease subunit [Saccharopolyspora antimicrobica]RKT87238.1 TRAP-type C4-dicarboxylate transport system permease large subunit [Saccharopolyspora antimicrobica]SFN03931.1 TRAP-type C4-dicarboxylate transport system, large permease component [Saccharopolyspora antimicrobica]